MSRLIRTFVIYTLSQSIYRSIRFILQQGTLKINGDNQEVKNLEIVKYIAFLRKMRYDVTDLNEVKNIEPENVLQL